MQIGFNKLNTYNQLTANTNIKKQNKPAFGAVVFDKLPEADVLAEIIHDKAVFGLLADRLNYISDVAKNNMGKQTKNVLKETAKSINKFIDFARVENIIGSEMTLTRNGRRVKPEPLFLANVARPDDSYINFHAVTIHGKNEQNLYEKLFSKPDSAKPFQTDLPEELHNKPFFVLHANTKDGKIIGSEQICDKFSTIMSGANVMRDIISERMKLINESINIDNFAQHAKSVFRNG